MGNIMRRMMSKEKRQQIIQDLISGKKSVVELGDETRMLILSDIIVFFILIFIIVYNSSFAFSIIILIS